jgi:hypothetical protein
MKLDKWVAKNVIPILWNIPSPLPGVAYQVKDKKEASQRLLDFFRMDDTLIYITSDWPDDIRYLCEELITGPGMMIGVPRIVFDMVRVDAYPTNVKGAVQHNAWWDAMALKELFRQQG